jgi:ribose transport system substrate-binding protein
MRLKLTLALLFLVVPSGCNREQKRVIGVVPKGANHLFWQTVHAGALKAGAEFGFTIEWNAPPTEIDASRQIDILESMVNRRLSGIAVAPVDQRALVSVVERADQAGVPVAIFDSDIETQKRLTYIATNNEEAGRIAARRLGEIIGGKGKVAIIGFRPGSASTMQRESGFQDELAKKFPQVQMVALQFGNADRAKALAATENVLTAHPDLAGLYADNESSVAGAAQALKSRNDHKTKLVAMDASDQLLKDMKDGWIDSFILQDPFKMGYESVKAIALKLKGQQPVAVLDSGVYLVTPADLAKPEIKALLEPDLSAITGRH